MLGRRRDRACNEAAADNRAIRSQRYAARVCQSYGCGRIDTQSADHVCPVGRKGKRGRSGVTGPVASSPSERAAPALWGGNLLEFPRGLGQFQLSSPTEPRCQMRSSGKSQRQGPVTPLVRDRWIGSHMLGKCSDLSLRSHSQYRFIQPIMRLRHSKGVKREEDSLTNGALPRRASVPSAIGEDRKEALVGRAQWGTSQPTP